MTDADFMLAVLSEQPGEWISQATILQRSADARGFGMTVHSRASDLRNRGHVIENRCERVGTRVVSYYRLLPSLSSAPDSQASPLGLGDCGLGADVSEVALARPESAEPVSSTQAFLPESEGPASLTLFEIRPAEYEPEESSGRDTADAMPPRYRVRSERANTAGRKKPAWA